MSHFITVHFLPEIRDSPTTDCTGRASIASVGRVLLGEFMDRWLEERVYPRLRSQTCMLYAREVRLRLRPELGDIPLQRLAARDVSAMEERLSRGGAGPSVLQTCRQVLSTVLNYAVHLELVSRNPVNGMGAVGYHRRSR